jgi:hypothetical protein
MREALLLGTDIHGWVEYWAQDAELWVSVIRLAPLVSDRNYQLFAWLFGVRRRPDIPMRWKDTPIAANRGLPPDASAEAAADYRNAVARYPKEFYGVTWVTWREVQAIDWDERIEDRIVESRREAQSGQDRVGVLWWRTSFVETHADNLPVPADELAPGQRWVVGDKAYEVVAMRRRDVFERQWVLLFELMEILARHCEDSDHLRLVVWFDG